MLDGDGGFPRTAADLWDHADLDEVRRECRAQLERAIYWGFDVSHLDAHLDAVQLKPEFFDVFLDLAEEFRLPLRLPDAGAQRLAGFPFRELAADRGVVSPDRVILTPGRPAPARAAGGSALGAGRDVGDDEDRARRARGAARRPRAGRHRDLLSARARHRSSCGQRRPTGGERTADRRCSRATRRLRRQRR